MKKSALFFCLCLLAILASACTSVRASESNITSSEKVVVEKFQGYDSIGKAVYLTETWVAGRWSLIVPNTLVLSEGVYRIVGGMAWKEGIEKTIRLGQMDRLDVQKADIGQRFSFPLEKK